MTSTRYGPNEEGQHGRRLSPEHSSEEAFETLAVPHLGSLYNFACWLVHNPHDAEDLVQETYLKALRGFGSFQPGTNFRAWIFRILKNTLASSRSRLATRMTTAFDVEGDLAYVPEISPTPESVLIWRRDIESVQSAIEALPEIYREVILLSEVEDASYREIADILAIPIGTVMSRLARARQVIRRSLVVAVSGSSRSLPKLRAYSNQTTGVEVDS